jgi:hypothetical protein
MGIGLQLPAQQEELKAHPSLTYERYGYRYSLERKGDISMYCVNGGADSLCLPVHYAVGLHMQTFVLEYQGRYYESLVSYFVDLGGLAMTLGDAVLRPRNLVEAMGREMPDSEVTACFGCHASNSFANGKFTPATLTPGLDCEHCHVGAGAHMQSLSKGTPGVLPKKLGALDAEDTSIFCGQCHRTWDFVVRLHEFGKVNVRFQPYRLANSKCFRGDDRRISCTGCHDPHAPLVTGDTGYDRNCLACHGAKQSFKPCPVATDRCVTCHMPKVRLAEGNAAFTDHQIRVVHPGEPYPN